jgi:probable HAF family extracellular repeat protein
VTHSIARLVLMTAAGLAVVAHAGGFDRAEQDQETTYTVDDLPSLGGTRSLGNAINDGGAVAGYSNHEGNQAREATLWLNDQVHPLGTLGGTNSSVPWAGKIKHNLVIGIAQTNILQPRNETWSCRIFFPAPDNAKYTCLGFVWENGEMRDLPTLGGDNGFAAAANNQRQVAGWAETTVEDGTCEAPQQLQFLPVVWDLNTDQVQALPPFPGDSSGAATGINDLGQVVGISGDCDQAVGRRTARHAVLWDTDGTVKDLGNVGGELWNTPTAITENGDIVVGFGSSPGDDPDNPRFRAFLWTEREDVCDKLPGTDICDLGTLDANGTAQAWGVNERGQVVGTSCPPAGLCKAFLWENGEMKNLNEVKGDYAHHLDIATDINNSGQFTGRAITDTGDRLAILATPTRRP